MIDMRVFLVRLKADLGFPESALVVHIVPADQIAPAVMVPYCGIVLRAGTVDPPLEGLQGAPCEACIRKTPIPGIEEAPPALPKRKPDRDLPTMLDDLLTDAVGVRVHCALRSGRHCPTDGGDSGCARASLPPTTSSSCTAPSYW